MKKLLSTGFAVLLCALFIVGCSESDKRKKKKKKKNGIVTSALSSSRARAQRLSSMSNLKQIGLGIKQYANMMRWEGCYPDKLDLLVKTKRLTDCNMYVAPFDKKAKVASSIPFKPENLSYVLVPGLTESDPSDAIAAFEYPKTLKHIGGKSINVLYVDGSCQIITAKEYVDFSKMSAVEFAQYCIKNGHTAGAAYSKKTNELLLKAAGEADEFFANRKF